MSFESTLVTALKSHSALASLVGPRVYHHRMPEEPTLPCVVINRVGGARLHALGGSIKASTPRFYIDLWDEDMTSVIGSSDALEDAILTMWGTAEVNIIDVADSEEPRGRMCRRRFDVRFTHAGR
jgi:hypothetical protein